MRRLIGSAWARVKSVWHWLMTPFRHVQRYYEPWMLSSWILLGVAAAISAYWLLGLLSEAERESFPYMMLPWLLAMIGLGLLALIGYSFWRPNARNLLTTPLYLRRFYRPWMLTVLSLLAIVGMGLGFWKLRPSNPVAPEPKPVPDQSISLRFEKVELRGRKQGTPFFTILAEKVEVTKDNRYVNFLKGNGKPHGEFYNLKDWEEDPTGAEPKRRAITWESNEASYDTIEKNLVMRGEVRIKTDAGDTIETEEMIWSQSQETLISNTRTKIHTHQDTYLNSNKVKVETRSKSLFLEGQVFIDMKIGEDRIIDVEEF